MAIPAIIGVAARRVGAGVVTGSKLAGRAAYAGLKSSVTGSIRAQGSPVLNKAYDTFSSIRDARKARTAEKKEKESSKTSNQEKAEKDEAANKDRQDKAQAAALEDTGEKQVGVLKVISKDTKDILAGIELLVEEGIQGKEKSGGLLSGIMGLLGGLTIFSKGFLPRLGGFFAKAALRLGSTVSGMISRALGGVLGTVAKAGSGIARAAGSVGKAALAAGGTLAARGALAAKGVAKTGASAAKVAGTTGKLVGKTAGKTLLKKIPLIGAGVGLALAANRAMAGDWTGAGMEAASGLASTVPGLGTAASLGIDAALLARDLKRNDAGGEKHDFSNVTGGSSTSETARVLAKSQSDEEAKSMKTLLQSMTWTLRSMLSNMTSPSKGIFTKPVEKDVEFDWSAFTKNNADGTNSFSGPGQASSDPNYTNTSTLNPMSGNSSAKASGDAAGLLDLIASGESGKAGYDAIWNGSRVKTSKPLSQMTFGEVMQWQKDTLNEQISRGVPENRRSSAAGRYQFISSTLKNTMKSAGFSEDDMFSPENQDKLAVALLNADKNNGLKAWREGRASDADFINYVASQWASVKTTSGKGAYDAAGFNHGSIGGNSIIASLTRKKPNFSNVVNGSTPKDPVSAQVRESVVKHDSKWRVPMIAPTTIVQQAPSGGGGGSMPATSVPMIAKNPDHILTIYGRSLIQTT